MSAEKKWECSLRSPSKKNERCHCYDSSLSSWSIYFVSYIVLLPLRHRWWLHGRKARSAAAATVFVGTVLEALAGLCTVVALSVSSFSGVFFVHYLLLILLCQTFLLASEVIVKQMSLFFFFCGFFVLAFSHGALSLHYKRCILMFILLV